jgi:hypothetical protein
MSTSVSGTAVGRLRTFSVTRLALAGAAIAALAIVAAPTTARGAAAAVGESAKQAAQTKLSLGNVSTNAEARQIQLTFDPVVADPAGTPLAIQQFQLDFSYDASQVSIVSECAISPWVITNYGTSSSTTPGLVTGVSGIYSGLLEEVDPPNTDTSDQDFFTVTFQLNDNADPNSPINFAFFAGMDDGSNVQATDPNDPTQTVYTSTGADVTPAYVTASLNGGFLNADPPGSPSSPEPGTFAMACLGLPALGWFMWKKRKGAPASR